MKGRTQRCWPLWLLLGQILFVVNQAGSPPDKAIRIGYLLRNKARAGAINVAIEQAQNDGILRDYNFRYYILYATAVLVANCHKQTLELENDNAVPFPEYVI